MGLGYLNFFGTPMDIPVPVKKDLNMTMGLGTGATVKAW